MHLSLYIGFEGHLGRSPVEKAVTHSVVCAGTLAQKPSSTPSIYLNVPNPLRVHVYRLNEGFPAMKHLSTSHSDQHHQGGVKIE